MGQTIGHVNVDPTTVVISRYGNAFFGQSNV